MSRKKEWDQGAIELLMAMYEEYTYEEIAQVINQTFGTKYSPNAVRKAHERYKYPVITEKKSNKPKILLLDIETTPLVVFAWSLYDLRVNLDQVIEDITILSFAAKWYGSDELIYEDVKDCKNVKNDKKLLKSLKKLLDEADIVVGHNSKKFDIPLIKGRMAIHGMKPPSHFKQMDTLQMSNKFRFISKKLAYLTKRLCTKFVKSNHAKFPGFSMWTECMSGNKEAFKEMEDYNKLDVTSLEELFQKLLPWESASLFDVYNETDQHICTCGSTDFKKSGYYYTNSSKFQKYQCVKCGAESRDSKNLLTKKVRRKL